MKLKPIRYIEKQFFGVNTPVLIVAILVSAGLWYLNKLGHTYTTTVSLPVTIVNGPESAVGVLQNRNDVECRVEGTGYELLAYRWNPLRHILEIDLRRIDVKPVEGSNRSEVILSSLQNAISEQLTDIRLLSILTPRVEISTAPFRSLKVPVKSRIDIEFRTQHMPIGPIVFTPDSVEAKSLDFLVDTLQAVYTVHREYFDVSAPLSGRIALKPIQDVVLPINEVVFGVAVEEYTEVELKLPLSLRNAPEGRIPVILPGDVTVRMNVARSRYADTSSGEIRAWIDYDDRLTNVGKQFKVYVPVPEGIVVKQITPIYVELLFEEL